MRIMSCGSAIQVLTLHVKHCRIALLFLDFAHRRVWESKGKGNFQPHKASGHGMKHSALCVAAVCSLLISE